MALASGSTALALASQVQALVLALRAALTAFGHHPQTQIKSSNNKLIIIYNEEVFAPLRQNRPT